MRIASWMKRLLALFLSLCTIVGLLPAVGFFALEADAAITDEISALVSELTAQYGDFKIPATKAKYVTGSTVGNLDGTYFLFIMARDKGSASQHRMINFDGWPASQYDRLSENCYDKKPVPMLCIGPAHGLA